VTEYVPGIIYTWTGFFSYDMVPSPKSHDQRVGDRDDVSEKPIGRALLPDVRFATKSAIGTWKLSGPGDDTGGTPIEIPGIACVGPGLRFPKIPGEGIFAAAGLIVAGVPEVAGTE
jgi:hypothetical protein